MNELINTGLNCLQPGFQSGYGYLQQMPAPVEREPRPRELTIEGVGGTIRMDYGAELRLLIADPLRGMHLRDAIQKLKEALLEEY